MKLWIGLCVALVSGSLCWAADFKSNVGVTKTLLLGSPVYHAAAVTNWAATTQTLVGQLVVIGNTPFVCIATNAAGYTGPTSPGMGVGSDVVDSNVTWRPVVSKQRSLLVLENRGTTKVTVGLHGGVVGVGTGLVLEASAKIGLTGADCPQSAVWAMSEAGTTNEVGGTEK
jgi:hypothetical protein